MNDIKITITQLEQYLSKAAWILKGPVDASDFKVYIFPLLFFKRISDVYDEEYRLALQESGGDKEYASLPEMHRFEIPENCHWNDVRQKTTNVGLAIETALRGIEQANQEFLYGIFGDAQWSNKNKLSDRLLIDLIEHYSQYSLSNENVNPDILGQAYEYLIEDVIEFCDNTLAFQCSLLLGAIAEFLFVDEPIVGMDAAFKIFQKALKYGLPDSLSISIYEKGFSDRCVAIRVRDELKLRGYDDLYWGESADLYYFYLDDILDNYPSYFQTVLDSV